MSESRRPVLHELAESLGRIEVLDPLADRLSAAVRGVLPPGTAKDALSGTWIGHAFHPLMTDVPIGSWTSATVLDLVGGRQSRKGADRLMGLGLLSSLPTVASGLSDWSDTGGADRRIGLVHAWANGAALALYGGSYAARKAGRRRMGVLLGLAGGGALAAGGFLGGHLSYARGVGVDNTVFEDGPDEWTATMLAGELADGKPHKVSAGGVDVLLVRRGERVLALSNACTHRGAPLSEGELDGDCVTCPWHGSRFDLEDGSVLRGPATGPQPVWETRVTQGRVEVRPRAAA